MSEENEFNELNLKLSNLDDLGENLQKTSNTKSDCKLHVNSRNNNYITEAGLAKLLQFVSDENKTFVVISAFRADLTKEENIQRGRILRAKFAKKEMWVYLLLGHWKELPLDNLPNKKYPEDSLVDVIERIFMVIKPDSIDEKDFEDLAISLMTIQGEKQDAILFKNPKGFFLIFDEHKREFLGKELTLSEIEQAYSQHSKRMESLTIEKNIPFVFEGTEIPGSNSGRMMFKYENVKYVHI